MIFSAGTGSACQTLRRKRPAIRSIHRSSSSDHETSLFRGGASPSLRGPGALLLFGVRPGLAGSSPRYFSTFRALIASTHLYFLRIISTCASESVPRAVASESFEKDLLTEPRSLPLAVLTRRRRSHYFSANSRTTIVSFSSANPCGFLMKSPYLSCSRNSTLEPSLKNVADLTFFGILGIASTGSCQFRM